MLANLRLDVALIARLRPAALVVPARLLLGVVGEILEPASAEAVEVPELAADHDDEGALPAPDERHERSQVERSSHVDLVGHGFRQGKRPPDVVEPGGEDREPVRPVPLELAFVEGADPLEVRPEPDALVVRHVAPVGAVPLRGLVEEGVQPRDRVPGSRRHFRVEIEIEADRAALLALRSPPGREAHPR